MKKDIAPTRHPSKIERKFITEKEACIYIGMSRPFLARSRVEGNRKGRTPGPPYYKIGRAIRYSIDDLDFWLEEHRQEMVSPP